MNAITHFIGEYKFLSNFYPTEFEIDGVLFKSVEHAYQSAKALLPEQAEYVRAAPTAAEAKRRGRKVAKIPEWESKKLLIMERYVLEKFIQNGDLASKLLQTGDAELIEGNWWGDTFWGVCGGVGRNELGKILMHVRAALLLGKNL